jgi:hypothetical protein
MSAMMLQMSGSSSMTTAVRPEKFTDYFCFRAADTALAMTVEVDTPSAFARDFTHVASTAASDTEKSFFPEVAT